MSSRAPTRVCVLTPSGRGAVAVVAVEGPAAVSVVDDFFQAVSQRPLSAQAIGRILYGRWGSVAGEDLVVCRRSQQSLEVHCHGGGQSSAQIVADLTAAGCLQVPAAQWLAHQVACPIRAAAHQALAHATTDRTAAHLLAQYHGALRRELEAIAAGAAEEALARVQQLLQWAALGQHLTQPWRVAIAGQPNVGKSSLINALVGFQRALVFDQPGTTRDVVSSLTAIQGWPVTLSDTAGLHATADTIEGAGIELARQQVAAADLTIWVLDASRFIPNETPGTAAKSQAEQVGVVLNPEKTILVMNKIDLVDHAPNKTANWVTTCAVTSEGVDRLLVSIGGLLVPKVPSEQTPLPFTSAQVACLEAAGDALRQQNRPRATAALERLLAPPAR